ncbi:MAG: CoB--CoM heterodisulfide reductase iron-sulfur subunit B family protein [Phycisphaerae bacterium]|nr:CoB--CoM heterodisulfide reductase iron-sulfur subunit B family protein [Phycisphaerae bacterium]
MKLAYFPGCSAESTARDMHMSSLAVAQALGIELIEPEGWSCCGATAGHQTDRVLATALSAASLAKVADMGLDMVLNCAACFGRMKTANHDLQDMGLRKQVADAIGRDYDGSVIVRHLIDVLLHDIGLDRIKAATKKSLSGLKVASYYGCLLVRPADVMQFDDPENPTCMDTLVEALGGEALDWPHKVECCGGGLSLTRTDLVVSLSDKIVTMASEAGADCIVVACPMCQVNLDMRQIDIKKQGGQDHNLPILYITQLLGLALGIGPDQLGLSKLMIAPDPVVNRVTSA